MKKKILIGLGAAILGLFFVGVVLTSLGGARRTYPLAPLLQAPFGVENRLDYSGKGGEGLAEETGQVSSETPSRLVIKTGRMNMVVKDINDSLKRIIQHAEEKGGWVVSSSMTEREEIPSGSITIRVPAENFDEAMDFVRGLAEKVTYEGTEGQDVTEEYTDLQSRLRNLEATEVQLLKIMERSGTIPDVLAAQSELTKVRGQIEQTKGRIHYLERSAKMATIRVNLALSEELLPIPPAEKWLPKYVLKQAWMSLLGFLRSVSYFFIWVGVYAVIWVPLVIVVLLVRKFRKKRNK